MGEQESKRKKFPILKINVFDSNKKEEKGGLEMMKQVEKAESQKAKDNNNKEQMEKDLKQMVHYLFEKE